jgi:hypothetical protein
MAQGRRTALLNDDRIGFSFVRPREAVDVLVAVAVAVRGSSLYIWTCRFSCSADLS